jgi:hypothetical protein
MTIIPISKLFEGGSSLVRIGQLIVFYSDITGTIKGFDVWLKNNLSIGTGTFDVSINGVKQFVGSEMTITAAQRHASKTGLSIAIVEGDFVALEYVGEAIGGLGTPVAFIMKVDDGTPTYTLEEFQDTVAAMFLSGSHTSWTYNDTTGKLNVDAIQLTDEEIQDKVGAFLSGGANTTVTYNDGANTLVIAETTAGKTQEEIEDIIAGLLQQGSNVTLTYNDGSNTLTVAASGGGGSLSQGTVVGTTASVANNVIDNISMALGKYSMTSKLATDKEARVRVYSTSAYRTADAARPIGTDPTGEHGVLLEVVTTTGNLTIDLAPIANLYDGESSRTGNLSVAVTNMSGGTNTIQVTITNIILEA